MASTAFLAVGAYMADDGEDDPSFGLSAPFTPEGMAVAFFRLCSSHARHLKGCDLQWKANNARLRRIEGLIIASCAALISTMALVLGFLLTHLVKIS